MATINYTETIANPAGNLVLVEWSNMANLDVGQTYAPGFASDRSVQVEGTFGGATCAIEGSNYQVGVASTFRTLNNPAVAALNISAASIQQVLEVTNQIRPNVTGGGGGTLLNVKILFHRSMFPNQRFQELIRQ